MSRRTLLVPVLIVVFALLAGATYLLFPPSSTRTKTSTPVARATSSGLAAQGQKLVVQLGCFACHTTDGTNAAGPTWRGLAGSRVKLTDGSTVVADDAYLRQSIVDPDAKIVSGYAPGVMSLAINDQINTIQADDNLNALVAYIDSLR